MTGAMTKAPPLLSAPNIKGIHGNVIIDFTISASLSHDAPTLRRQVRPSPKYRVLFLWVRVKERKKVRRKTEATQSSGKKKECSF